MTPRGNDGCCCSNEKVILSTGGENLRSTFIVTETNILAQSIFSQEAGTRVHTGPT